jgi:hypothetical protein
VSCLTGENRISGSSYLPYRSVKTTILSGHVISKSYIGLTENSHDYLHRAPDWPGEEEFSTWLNSREVSIGTAAFSAHDSDFDTGWKRSNNPPSDAPKLFRKHPREDSPTEDSASGTATNRPSRRSATIKERPPCLRCKILKRKVCSPIRCPFIKR